MWKAKSIKFNKLEKEIFLNVLSKGVERDIGRERIFHDQTRTFIKILNSEMFKTTSYWGMVLGNGIGTANNFLLRSAKVTDLFYFS